MNQSDLHKFFSRPGIKKQPIAKEAGISRSLLTKILSGKRTLTKETARKLLPVMEKYGYKQSEQWKIN